MPPELRQRIEAQLKCWDQNPEEVAALRREIAEKLRNDSELQRLQAALERSDISPIPYYSGYSPRLGIFR